MIDDIIDVFERLLKSCGSVDIADAEFKKLIHEDDALHEAYRRWCDETGSTEKRGFLDYADEYLDSQELIWNNLNDYDE